MIFKEFNENNSSDNYRQAQLPGFTAEEADLDLPSPERAAAIFHCRECGSPNISVYYKNDYYYRCGNCGNIMLVTNIGCLTCGRQLRLHEDNNQFFFQCKTCGTTKLFITNPAQDQECSSAKLI